MIQQFKETLQHEFWSRGMVKVALDVSHVVSGTVSPDNASDWHITTANHLWRHHQGRPGFHHDDADLLELVVAVLVNEHLIAMTFTWCLVQKLVRTPIPSDLQEDRLFFHNFAPMSRPQARELWFGVVFLLRIKTGPTHVLDRLVLVFHIPGNGTLWDHHHSLLCHGRRVRLCSYSYKTAAHKTCLSACGLGCAIPQDCVCAWSWSHCKIVSAWSDDMFKQQVQYSRMSSFSTWTKHAENFGLYTWHAYLYWQWANINKSCGTPAQLSQARRIIVPCSQPQSAHLLGSGCGHV